MKRLAGFSLLVLNLLACGHANGVPEGESDSGAGEKASMEGTQSMQRTNGMERMSDMPGMNMGADTSGVPIDRPAASRLGITFARTAERPVRRKIVLAGTLDYAEPSRTYVTARVDGFVEKLHANYTGKPVSRGEPLLALYSPDLVSAQEEYLTAKRLGDGALVDAARQRLALWDIPPDQIAALDRTGRAQRRLLLRAPASGEIAEKLVTAGQAVRAGDNLFLITDRATMWVDVAVFEMDAPVVRVGTPASVKVGAVPGRQFQGKVAFLHPGVDTTTRTLTARIEVANPDRLLRAGMFASVEIAPSGIRGVAVPIEAVLPTGTRNLVFVNRGDGRFQPREVEIGARGDSLIQIVQGLKPGDEVVASATYLLDSESNLAAAMQGIMLQMGMGLDMGGMEVEEGDRQ
jgi:Cu(I)/Ag(I) efflux system membrane fusion protein